MHASREPATLAKPNKLKAHRQHPTNHRTLQIAKVRGPLGELVKDLKAGLKNRKANPNRKKSRMRAAPKAADSAPAYKQASEMKKSLSQTLLNSNTNLQGQTAAQGASPCLNAVLGM